MLWVGGLQAADTAKDMIPVLSADAKTAQKLGRERGPCSNPGLKLLEMAPESKSGVTVMPDRNPSCRIELGSRTWGLMLQRGRPSPRSSNPQRALLQNLSLRSFSWKSSSASLRLQQRNPSLSLSNRGHLTL